MIPGAEAAIHGLGSGADGVDRLLSRARQHYQSEKRFRALVENSSDAICLLERDGAVLYASASTERVIGYSAHELTGTSGFHLGHPADQRRVRRMFQRVLGRPREPLQWQSRVRHKDGGWRWVECSGSNLLTEPSIGAIVVNYRDVTERRAAEESLRRHAAELARSNAELRAFAWAAAQDLKEPLRTVCAFTQLLVRSADVDPRRDDFATLIVDSVGRMSSLLDDLLSFTSLDFSDAEQRVDLGDAVAQVVGSPYAGGK